MLSTALLIVVSLWVVIHLWAIRRVLLLGEAISTPAFAVTLVLGLGLVIGALLGVSAVHLWWWVPLSVVISTALIFSPQGAKFIMACLALLAWPFPLEKH